MLRLLTNSIKPSPSTKLLFLFHTETATLSNTPTFDSPLYRPTSLLRKHNRFLSSVKNQPQKLHPCNEFFTFLHRHRHLYRGSQTKNFKISCLFVFSPRGSPATARVRKTKVGEVVSGPVFLNSAHKMAFIDDNNHKGSRPGLLCPL